VNLKLGNKTTVSRSCYERQQSTDIKGWQFKQSNKYDNKNNKYLSVCFATPESLTVTGMRSAERKERKPILTV
jgi:hypothetical protein